MMKPQESTGRAMDFLAAHRVKLISTLLLAATGLLLWKFQTPEQLPPKILAAAPVHQIAPVAPPITIKSATPVAVHVVAPVPAVVKKPKIVAAAPMTDAQKLLAMKGYTLQLVGVRTSLEAKHFLARTGLRGHAYTFKTSFKGKPWYVVVAGRYATAAAAKAGMQALPKSMHPWVRPLSSVHKAIKASA